MMRTNLLKVLFAVLTGYLLLVEMLFYLSKPTHTTVYKEHTNLGHIPDVTICPYPGYDMDQLKKYGYKRPSHFARGITNESYGIGWGGVTNETTEHVMQAVSMMRSPIDCPVTILTLNSERLNSRRLNMSIARPFHPTGRCCNAKIPYFEDKTKDTIFSIMIKPKENNITLHYKVYLSDQQSAYYTFTNKFNMLGKYFGRDYHCKASDTFSRFRSSSYSFLINSRK